MRIIFTKTFANLSNQKYHPHISPLIFLKSKNHKKNPKNHQNQSNPGQKQNPQEPYQLKVTSCTRSGCTLLATGQLWAALSSIVFSFSPRL